MFSGLGAIVNGINAETVGGLVNQAAAAAAAGFLVNGFNQQLGSVLGQVLPHPTATPAQPVATVPTATIAQVQAMPPAVATAFFNANGHIVG